MQAVKKLWRRQAHPAPRRAREAVGVGGRYC